VQLIAGGQHKCGVRKPLGEPRQRAVVKMVIVIVRNQNCVDVREFGDLKRWRSVTLRTTRL
jgi:hypothetical protein